MFTCLAHEKESNNLLDKIITHFDSSNTPLFIEIILFISQTQITITKGSSTIHSSMKLLKIQKHNINKHTHTHKIYSSMIIFGTSKIKKHINLSHSDKLIN